MAKTRKCRKKIGGYCHYKQNALGNSTKQQIVLTADYASCSMYMMWLLNLRLNCIKAMDTRCLLKIWLQSGPPSDTKPSQPKATLLPIQFGIFLCCHNFFWGGFFTSVFCFFEAGSTSKSNSSIEQGRLYCESDNSTT